MPTVIDRLVVEIGLDPAKYKAGLTEALAAAAKGKDQLRRDSKDVEASTKGMGEFFGKLRGSVLGLAALFTGGLGLKEFVASVVGTDAHVGRLAKVLDTTVGTLSSFRNLGVLAGGTNASFSNTLRTITLELARLQLTGESQIIPFFRALGVEVIDDAGKFKNAARLLLEVADAIDKRKVDPARATLILQSMGADEATINAVLKGRAALEKYLEQARQAGTITDEDAKAAERLSNAWNEMTLSSTALGRSILTVLAPGLENVLRAVTGITKLLKTPGKMWDFFFAPNAWKRAPLEPGAPAPSRVPGGDTTFGSFDVESYIRESAKKRGVNPEVAVAVAKSEGLRKYHGDEDSTGKPTSFGPFQLHYRGVGRHTSPGLGEEFTKKTGLDARDQATVKQQVDFALDYAAKNGWSSWHGWRGAPFAGIPAAGAAAAAAGSVNNSRTSTSTSDTKIGSINVYTQAKEAGPIMQDAAKAAREADFGVQANQGQQ